MDPNTPENTSSEQSTTVSSAVAPVSVEMTPTDTPAVIDNSKEEKKEEEVSKEEDNFGKADFMGKESIGRVMWKLTYPSLIAKVVSALYAVCDSVFIGRLAGNTQDERTTALAAVSLAMPLEQGILQSVAMMNSQGGSTVYGQSIGEKNSKRGAKAIGNTYFLEIVSAIIVAIVVPFLIKPLLKLLGASDEAGTLSLATEYVMVLTIGCICYFTSMGSIDIIRGQGSAITSCVISIISGVLNMVGDPIYIKVFGLGVAGAALSTVLANLVSSICGFVVMRTKSVIHWKYSDIKPDCKMCGSIMNTGMSGIVSGFAAAFVTIISNRLVLAYSPYPIDDNHTKAILAAWGALGKVYFISFMPLIALAQGVLPMLAYSYGSKQHSRFIATSRLMFIWEIGISIVTEVVLFAFASPIAKLFSSEPLFIEFFVPALRYMVIGVFLQPAVMSLFPMLQSVGKGGLAGMLLALKTCFFLIVFQLVISWIMNSYWGAVYAYPVTEVLSIIVAIIVFIKNKESFTGKKELPVIKSE